MKRLEDGSLLVDGLLTADELADRLGLSDLPGGGEVYQTVGGMAMAGLGRVPAEGDGFPWEGWRFGVVDMDGNRVDKVLVAPLGEDSHEVPPKGGQPRPPGPTG